MTSADVLFPPPSAAPNLYVLGTVLHNVVYSYCGWEQLHCRTCIIIWYVFIAMVTVFPFTVLRLTLYCSSSVYEPTTVTTKSES